MLKRLISVMLAVLLVFATAAVAFADGDAAPGLGGNKSNVIFFDAKSAGWSEIKYVGFHMWEIGGSGFSDWGGKAERGVQVAVDSDPDANLWKFDFDAKGITLEDDKQYGVVFYNDKGEQAYNLLFDTTCMEDTAYCDPENDYENPEDSSKRAMPAFWTGQDPAVNGPELKISSIGNVVGTCIPKGMTAQSLFEDFLVNTLDNARTFSLKEDQELLDDIGAGLGLTADDVKDALLNADVSSSWQYDSSTLEKKPVDPNPQPSGSVINFDAKSAGWENSAYIGFHIWEYEGNSMYDWGAKQQRGTDADGDGVWTYDLEEHGMVLNPNKHYGVVFYNENAEAQTYDLLFDTTCFGDTAYCADDAVLENPVDSDKETKVAYWKNQDPTVNGPLMMVTTIGTVVGFCIPKGFTAFDLFLDFMLYNLESAEVYSGQTQQVLIENVARNLGITVEDVEDAIRIAGVEVNWNPSWSELAHKEPVPGEDERVGFKVDVTAGKGEALANKKYLLINYSLAPEYAYDYVLLETVADEGYQFDCWEIEGNYEIEDECTLNSSILPLKVYGSFTAHAKFKEAEGVKRGDYDEDGEITIMDATRAQNILAELMARPDDSFLTAVDADRDNALTIMDATRIQRVIAELCDWDGEPLSEEHELPPIPA